MARVETLRASFITGILSERLRARFDLERFTSGIADALNFIITPQGGAIRRPGSQFVVASKSDDPTVRLLPFQFSTEQTYMLEFGPGYLRVLTQGGQLVTTAVSSTITNGTFDTDLTGWTVASGSIAWSAAWGGTCAFTGEGATLEQDIILIDDDRNSTHTLLFYLRRRSTTRGAGMRVEIVDTTSGDIIDALGDDRRPLRAGAHSFTFNPAGLQYLTIRFITLTGNPGDLLLDDVSFLQDAPFELVTPFLEDDLPGLKTTQSADALYIAVGDREPMELLRTGFDEFQLQVHDFLEGPFLDINTSNITLDIGTLTNEIVASASIFSQTDLGRFLRIQNDDMAGEWVWLEIITYNSPTSVLAIERRGTLSLSAPTVDWRLGSWSHTTGWPSVVTLFRSRLTWAASRFEPQNVWLSTPDTLYSHEPSDPDGTVPDDAAINITIVNDQVNAVLWMVAMQDGLLIGTNRTEVILRRPALSTGLAPSNVEVVRQSARGSALLVLPALIGRSVIYLQRDAQTLREAVFDFELNGFTERDITILAEDLFRVGIVRLLYQQSPLSTLWALLADGSLACAAIERDQQVLAWTRADLSPTAGGPANVIDMATVTEGTEEQVWLLVRRVIDGQTVQYIELLTTLFDTDDPIEDAFFVDCGLSGVASPASASFSGLDHLVGETVRVLADGATHPDVTVASDGSVTLNRTVSQLQAGLPQTCRLELLPFELIERAATSVGVVKRVTEVDLILLYSGIFDVGRSTNSLTTVSFREAGDPMDSPVAPFTGRRSVGIDAVAGDTSTLVLESSYPLPLHVLGLNLVLEFFNLPRSRTRRSTR